ncbi:PAS domain-containing sensor histidine kinase [Opitutus sp. ER46]|uniref:sensor histidine kinase n=1 Tax=Opitutus sp. ER46 TaxID=2161864 RepID=UPI000D3188F8|nr:PAS domain-containing sensor histidine kinase [Opitutus sp. ER46]PTX94431.1 histidine kinase [Opitutus sp. ER46]
MSTTPDPIAPLDDATAEMCLGELLRSLNSLVYFKDHQSRFIAVSSSKAARHQLLPADLVGKSDRDLFADIHADETLADEERIMRTGEPLIAKLEKVEWRDGRETWSETSKLPLRDAAGAIIGTYGLTHDVTERERVGQELEQAHRALLETSRLAGMAEVATGVLHNVGNVLTSLNVSANVLSGGLRQTKTENLARVAALLAAHEADLATFVTDDPKGRLIPEYIETLSRHLVEERDRLLAEVGGLQQNIDHIKEIITMQQAYATTAGVVEPLAPATLVEDALRMNTGALLRHAVTVVREFQPVPLVRAERGKVLQILVNLIRNAKYAVDDAGRADKIIRIRIESDASGYVRLIVADNGIGITPENITHIFQHGFTTRAIGGGHGFGLHSARRAATELKGRLTAESDGPGQGARFTLELPVAESAITGTPAVPASAGS